MRSSLLTSVDVKIFYATEAYSSVNVPEVKYNMKILPTDEKEKVIAYKTQQLQSLRKTVHLMTKIKF
jgi:hypothetical protein